MTEKIELPDNDDVTISLFDAMKITMQTIVYLHLKIIETEDKNFLADTTLEDFLNLGIISFESYYKCNTEDLAHIMSRIIIK